MTALLSVPAPRPTASQLRNRGLAAPPTDRCCKLPVTAGLSSPRTHTADRPCQVRPHPLLGPARCSLRVPGHGSPVTGPHPLPLSHPQALLVCPTPALPSPRRADRGHSPHTGVDRWWGRRPGQWEDDWPSEEAAAQASGDRPGDATRTPTETNRAAVLREGLGDSGYLWPRRSRRSGRALVALLALRAEKDGNVSGSRVSVGTGGFVSPSRWQTAPGGAAARRRGTGPRRSHRVQSPAWLPSPAPWATLGPRVKRPERDAWGMSSSSRPQPRGSFPWGWPMLPGAPTFRGVSCVGQLTAHTYTTRTPHTPLTHVHTPHTCMPYTHPHMLCVSRYAHARPHTRTRQIHVQPTHHAPHTRAVGS